MSESQAASRVAVLVFTDIVASTELKSRIGTTTYARLLSRHDELFKQLIAAIPQAEILNDSGDGFFAAFAAVSDAVRFALRFQQAMHDEPWDPRPLQTRVGIHMGEVAEVAGREAGKPKIVGFAADLAARIASLAQGGQILMTRVAFDEARQFIGAHADGTTHTAQGPPLRWVAHGDYLIKGCDDSVEVFEVGAEGIAPLSPPMDTEDSRRSVSAEQEETLGWRPAIGLEVPQRLHWVLERKLGEGTFGEVWLARQETLKHHRVFKFCFDADRLRSFKREMTLFRLLRDALGERRDIAAIFDVRLDHPPFFLEGEFAPSGNLSDWSADGALGRIPLEARLEIVAKVAVAVAAAHSVGVLHKDIKPSNILMHVEPDGTLQPRLSDFGIGILTDHTQLKAHHITEVGFTSLGDNESSRTGTRMYSPPESLTGKPFTTQGDIYALGVLLYQMTIADLNRPLAPGWERDIDDELIREDIGKCVDGDPARRLSSAAELAQRIRALPARAAERQHDRDIEAAHARRGRMLRAAMLFGAACALIAIVSIAGYFRERSLHRALAISESLARESETTAQVGQLNMLLLAGDTFVQAGHYDEAMTTYQDAETLASNLNRSTLAATSGLLEARSLCPPPLMKRRPTTRLSDPVSAILRVRASLDGKFIVSGDVANRVFVTDMVLGRHVATIPLRGWGTGVAFTNDGKSCLIGSSGGNLLAFDVGKWDKPRATAETTFISALAAAPDGKTAVSVSTDRRIVFWTVTPLMSVRTFTAPAGLLCAAFSPDGKLLATGDTAGNVLLWDIVSGKIAATLRGHTDQVRGIAFTPDGHKLLSGGSDKTARVWDVATDKTLFKLEGHKGIVRDVAVSHDGRRGATASMDESVIVWDMENGEELRTISRQPQGALSVDFLPNDSGLVTSGGGGTVSVWSFSSDDAPALALHTDRVTAVCICPDGRTVLSASDDRSIRQFDLATGRLLRSLATPKPASSIALSPDGVSALVGSSDGSIAALDLSRFELRSIDPAQLGAKPATQAATNPATQPLLATARYKSAIASAAISSNGSTALIASADGLFSILKWPQATGKTWQTAGPVMAAALSADGAQAVISADRKLIVVDTASGQILRQFPVTSAVIVAIAFSPDGKTIAAGSTDDAIRIWDLANGMSTRRFYGHVGVVRALAFFPDGQTLASGSDDETVRLWNLTSLRETEMRKFTGHTAGVTSLAISRDATTLLSGSADRTMRIWDLSRPTRFKELSRALPLAYAALDGNPSDPRALAALGQWYAFRGKDDWAVSCLESARSGGATISPLLAARSLSKLARPADAAPLFRQAAALGQAPQDYLELCIHALEHPPASRP